MGQECHRCGASTRWIERSAEYTPNDHHNNIYWCPNCERKIVSG